MADLKTKRRRAAGPSPARPGASQTPLLEWIAAGCGAAVAAGSIGYLVWEGLQPHHDAPALTATASDVIPSTGGFVVPVRIDNRSRATAAGVEVEGALALAGGESETSAVTFDYLPGWGNRSGGLAFRNDPRQGRLTLTIRGYVEP